MMKTKTTYNLVVSGMVLALSVVLPMLFHLTGVPQSGSVFLPMHIPVLIGGFLLGPSLGALVGALAPVLSFVLTGMPPAPRLPFMIAELAVYGLISGLVYYQLGFSHKKFGIYISLISAMVAGRLVYGIFLFGAGSLFSIPNSNWGAWVGAITTGIMGIIIQVVIIPPLIYALKQAKVMRPKHKKIREGT